MTIISPANSNIINRYQNQQYLPNNQTTTNSVKLKPQLTNDKVEISGKKKMSKTTKGLLIGAGILAAAGIIVGAVKLNQTNKIKKELTEIYDKTFDLMKKETDELGMEFVKPKLVFKKLKNSTQAHHSWGKNEITFNTKYLNRKMLGRHIDNDTVFGGGDLNLTEAVRARGSLFKKLPEGIRVLTHEEFINNAASSLRHELTHARQEQMLLNTECGLEELFKAFKTRKQDLTFESFMEKFPFYKNYKSKNCFKMNHLFKAYSNEGQSFTYKPKDIADALANYSTNGSAYNLNMLEVEAQFNQGKAFDDLEKYFPKFKLDAKTKELFSIAQEGKVSQLHDIIKAQQAKA